MLMVVYFPLPYCHPAAAANAVAFMPPFFCIGFVIVGACIDAVVVDFAKRCPLK